MIFVRGDVRSVGVVTDQLQKFGLASGLYANPEKSNIYFGGVSKEVQEDILRVTQFVPSSFPFRYLGVPLNAGRLNKDHFGALISKVHAALFNWSAHFLSYAGKIQLLNSVVFGLENFWCSTLLIPKGVSSLWNQWLLTYAFKYGSVWRMRIKGCFAESLRSIIHVRDELLQITGGEMSAKQVLASSFVNGKFSTVRVYNLFRKSFPEVNWVPVIWGKGIVPKHSFRLSLAMETKLLTIDRLRMCGMILTNRCYLCKRDAEGHRHLFFKCSYATELWRRGLRWMAIRDRSNDLWAEVAWVRRRNKRRHWKACWFRCCLATTVYSIWDERNARAFKGVERTVDSLFRHVQFIVCVQILHCFPSNSSILDRLNVYSDPVHLAPGDNSIIQLIPVVFEGKGFIHWSRNVKLALSSKNKLGFITGKCKAPVETDSKYQD
ncbi:hypothetical protein RND81_12G025800 [Saponaria officinalis]|uniref:Reverse transcriptase zinc-binding domain-containing protein n=1 Tax=Saponaria officinalis TaxID=3572 RepID=A0AAW1H6H2_SAPOF